MEPRDHSRIDAIGQILARGIIAMQIAPKAKPPPVSGNAMGSGDDNPLIVFLKSHCGPITCSAAAHHLQVSLSTARSRLNELVAVGRVRREGKGPGTRYQWIRDP